MIIKAPEGLLLGLLLLERILERSYDMRWLEGRRDPDPLEWVQELAAWRVTKGFMVNIGALIIAYTI